MVDASIDLSAEFTLRQAESDPITGVFTVRQIATKDLFADAVIRKTATRGLFSDFETAHWKRLDAEFIARNRDTRELDAEFSVAHWKRLDAEFIARNRDTRELDAEFSVAHWKRLDAEFQTAFWERLSAEFRLTQEVIEAHAVIRNKGTATLTADFTVNPVETLLGYFLLRQETQDLNAEFTVRHTDTKDLFSDFTPIRTATKDLFTDLIVRHTGTNELSAVFHVGQDSEDLSSTFHVGQDSNNLYSSFSVRQYREVYARFIVRQETYSLIPIQGEFRYNHYWIDIPSTLTVSRQGTPYNLESQIIIRHTATKDLTSEFTVRRTATGENLVADFTVIHTTQLTAEFTVATQSTKQLFAKFITGQFYQDLTSVFSVEQEPTEIIPSDYTIIKNDLSLFLNTRLTHSRGFIGPPVITDAEGDPWPGTKNSALIYSEKETGTYKEITVGWRPEALDESGVETEVTTLQGTEVQVKSWFVVLPRVRSDVFEPITINDTWSFEENTQQLVSDSESVSVSDAADYDVADKILRTVNEYLQITPGYYQQHEIPDTPPPEPQIPPSYELEEKSVSDPDSIGNSDAYDYDVMDEVETELDETQGYSDAWVFSLYTLESVSYNEETEAGDYTGETIYDYLDLTYNDNVKVVETQSLVDTGLGIHCQFYVKASSRNLKAVFYTHIGVEDLQSEFTVSPHLSLKAIFNVRQPETLDLVADFTPRYAASENIQAEMRVLFTDDIPAELIVRNRDTEGIFSKLQVAHWERLFADFTVLYGFEELSADFTVRQPEEKELPAEMKITRPGSENLFCDFFITNELSGWGNRVEFEVDYTKIDSDLTNYPVAIRLSSAAGTNSRDLTPIFDELGADWQRIAVTTDDGVSERYVEVEKWDESNEIAVLWVSVPTALASENTLLYLYYDSTHPNNTTYVGAAGSAVAENVWDSNFKQVNHFTNLLDSTGTQDFDFDNDVTKVDGDLGDAYEFVRANGSSVRVLTPNFDLAGAALSIELYCYVNDLAGDVVDIVDQRTNSGGITMRIISDGANSLIGARTWLNGAYNYSTDVFDADTWAYLAMAWGASVGNDTSWFTNLLKDVDSMLSVSMSDASRSQYVSSDWFGGNEFDGKIDELRISNIKRSDEYFKATYYCMKDNLLTYGEPGPV